MTKMKKKNSEYFLSGVIFITIIILSLFNRFKIDDYVNPDAEVECVFARAMWNEKTLFPVEWIHSTEPQNLKPSLLTSIFWGITQNMQLARTITLLLLMVFAFFCFRYMCTAIKGLKMTSILLGFELLLGAFGMQFMSLYFVIDGRYGFIMLSIFLLAGYVIRAKNGNIRKKDTVLLAVIFFLLGIVGPRNLMYTFFPFLIASIFLLFDSDKISINKDFWKKNEYFIALVIQMIANMLGLIIYILVFSKSDKIPADTTKAMWISVESFIDNLLIGLTNCLRIVGISGNEKLMSLSGIDLLIKLALIVICLFYLLSYSKKHCNADEKYLILLMGCGAVWAWILSSTLSISGNSTPQNQTWYYYYVVYMIVIGITIFFNYLSIDMVVRNILYAFVIVVVAINLLSSDILNWKYQGAIAEKEVAAVLLENNAKYVYAPYNTAYTIEQVSNEKIEAVSMTASFDVETAMYVDVWQFNLNTAAAANAMNEDYYFVVFNSSENEYMLAYKDSFLNCLDKELLAIVEDEYYIYKFDKYPFRYMR